MALNQFYTSLNIHTGHFWTDTTDYMQDNFINNIYWVVFTCMLSQKLS